MEGRYKIITLCGSSKFKQDFRRLEKDLTLGGNIVLTVGLFGHSGDSEVWCDDTKELLDDMHMHRINMCDAIYVVNKDFYIGDSTKKEIEYARSIGRKIIYMENKI